MEKRIIHGDNLSEILSKIVEEILMNENEDNEKNPVKPINIDCLKKQYMDHLKNSYKDNKEESSAKTWNPGYTSINEYGIPIWHPGYTKDDTTKTYPVKIKQEVLPYVVKEAIKYQIERLQTARDNASSNMQNDFMTMKDYFNKLKEDEKAPANIQTVIDASLKNLGIKNKATIAYYTNKINTLTSFIESHKFEDAGDEQFNEY